MRRAIISADMEARLIYNPTAGPRNVRRDLEQVCTLLERRGWTVEMAMTEGPGDAKRLARAAAEKGCGVAIAAGGDGTINEVVNGLVGTQTALGVLPVGTGNLWAKQLRISTYTLVNPFRLQEAAKGLVEGRIRTIDVGQVGETYFLCWAGIGLDAQVTTEMEPRDRHTKRLGALPYLIAAAIVAREFRGVRARISLDGRLVRSRALLILVSNIRQYGGVVEVAREACIDDGLLDVFIFKGLGFPYVVKHVVRILSQRYLDDPQVIHRQVRRVDVWTEPDVPVQVDGDPIDQTPVSLRVVPQALKVVWPPNAPLDLFAVDVDA